MLGIDIPVISDYMRLCCSILSCLTGRVVALILHTQHMQNTPRPPQTNIAIVKIFAEILLFISQNHY